ncbi:MAG: acetyl-CoA carboxylase biotin carboxylase subunit [Comamonadaceae bacterium]|nr:acetyl-CoA carboxylase biotin carboxylase subunit [Comamonadaceae bacterium]
MTPTPFHKLLIANRGEIALRVIRTARAMGYMTVAVYSTADLRSRHVLEADQAVCIGEPLPAQSYLNMDAIIEAARQTGADAVHPGYGFLAENAGFARACRDAGLVFIGPSPEAIIAMGHKAGAKKIMMEAGVPCIPGYQGADQSEARLQSEAERIGYPVMIKATAGGGGRGMRLVSAAKDFPDLLRSAQSEAQNAFGDPEVILERAITQPRHIEIQVFADRYGNAIHLGERDCSVQRRHQKVIEEAPSPAVDAQLRDRMGATAVAAVKAIGYEGAGTLEFLLDQQGDFYFMEMNTRLQVEHPVTEAITGLDLVEMQLRVAAGESLALKQDEVVFQGHAIEVRLCAEDVDKGFMPQSGTMLLWQAPASLRVEHALSSGAEIPPYYDSMIAKIIAHGANRDEARRRLMLGLHQTVALGVTTNQVFLESCLRHPVFAAGQATTGFIAQHQEQLLETETLACERAVAVAAVLLFETSNERPTPGGLRRLAHSLPVGMSLEIASALHKVQITQSGTHRFDVEVQARQHVIDLVELTQHKARLVVDSVMESAAFLRDGSQLLLHYRGQPIAVNDQTRSAAERATNGEGDGKVRASMNGRVVAVLVAEGDQVEAGQPIITLEAMKMEHVHLAPVSGRVSALSAALGEQVTLRRVLVEIEAPVAS